MLLKNKNFQRLIKFSKPAGTVSIVDHFNYGCHFFKAIVLNIGEYSSYTVFVPWSLYRRKQETCTYIYILNLINLNLIT